MKNHSLSAKTRKLHESELKTIMNEDMKNEWTLMQKLQKKNYCNRLLKAVVYAKGCPTKYYFNKKLEYLLICRDFLQMYGNFHEIKL